MLRADLINVGDVGSSMIGHLLRDLIIFLFCNCNYLQTLYRGQPWSALVITKIDFKPFLGPWPKTNSKIAFFATVKLALKLFTSSKVVNRKF